MDFTSGLALITAIAAFCSSMAALALVWEVSKQRRSAFLPEIAPSRTIFSILGDGKMNTLRGEGESEQPYPTGPTLTLVNVGVGAAIDVKIKWSYPLQELVEQVNEAVQRHQGPPIFTNRDHGLEERRSSTHFAMYSPNVSSTLDYVLPSSLGNPAVKLHVPGDYWALCSTYWEFAIREEKVTFELPALTLELSFFDIGGESHITKLALRPKLYRWEYGEGTLKWSAEGVIECKNRIAT